MAKKDQLKIEGTDTKLSTACDNLLDAKNKLERARAELHAAEEQLIAAMSEAGKKSVKHEGRIIRHVHQDAKDKVQVVTE